MVGLTALSVEIITNRSTPLASAASTGRRRGGSYQSNHHLPTILEPDAITLHSQRAIWRRGQHQTIALDLGLDFYLVLPAFKRCPGVKKSLDGERAIPPGRQTQAAAATRTGEVERLRG
jgi:hypothetical protein